jgi:CBS domain containing-hemolysin-like protein
LDPDILIRLFLLAAIVLLSAWFAGSETAFFSLSPLTIRRLKKEGHPKAPLLARLTSRPRELLGSLVIGNEFSDVSASVLASSIAISLLGGVGQLVAIAFMIPLMVLVGEVIPKVSAALGPVRFASAVARPVALWVRLISPVRWVADGLVGLVPARPEEQGRILEEEFLKWVRSSHKEGLVQELEREFIENLIAFERTTLAEVMTPRTDIFALEADTPVAEAIKHLRRRHFSRVPVYVAEEDNVIGILHAKDLLGRPQPETLCELLRPVRFAPESKRAEAMLWEMQRRRLHMVMVVDEYGGLAGLLTLDDLLEELFGEIYDEHELAVRPLKEKAPGLWAVSPRLGVEEFNERMNTSLPEEEGYETVGGFLLHAFGRLPTQGEEVAFDGLTFKAARLKGTRIQEIEVRATPQGEEHAS